MQSSCIIGEGSSAIYKISVESDYLVAKKDIGSYWGYVLLGTIPRGNYGFLIYPYRLPNIMVYL